MMIMMVCRCFVIFFFSYHLFQKNIQRIYLRLLQFYFSWLCTIFGPVVISAKFILRYLERLMVKMCDLKHWFGVISEQRCAFVSPVIRFWCRGWIELSSRVVCLLEGKEDRERGPNHAFVPPNGARKFVSFSYGPRNKVSHGRPLCNYSTSCDLLAQPNIWLP